METKVIIAECPNCNNSYVSHHYPVDGPFCTERCEDLYTENAPIELIAKAYKEYDLLERKGLIK